MAAHVSSATISHSAAPAKALLHPRSIGWLGTTALAMGGSNQSIFLLGAIFASQGSAAVPLLIVGLVLSWMALPGWIELVMMWPNRVGGIAATCAEAFRPYSPVLANLTGFCYWWGWVPTCGLTAILSASAIHDLYLHAVPVPLLASGIVLFFTAVNLAGVRWVARLAIPLAFASATLALLSAIVPVIAGSVDWHQATTFHLTSPFDGAFGRITSAMAGLYLIGFAAPAFEAAACHVGETVDVNRNVPRAMLASAGIATLYFVVLPIVWLGALGAGPLEGNLTTALGPTFAPLLAGAAKAAAVWFMVFNMFHGTLQPLAGAARTLMQLAEDGLLPRILALRTSTDAPLVATLLTAGMSIAFLLTGDPTWVIAAANLTYLIGICLPSVAVWLLRRDQPERARPFRAPRGTIVLGLLAATAWGASTVLGFEQFGLPTVLAGMALAYSGSALYAARLWSDRRAAGLRGFARSLHVKLTGAMLLVLTLDGAGYLLAVARVDQRQHVLVAALEDIFVAVALLTITVGLVLPGMIGHAVGEVAQAADRLATGTLADLTRALRALETGDLEAAHARVDVQPIVVYSRDEVGAMASSFNSMQEEVERAARSLDGARLGLVQAKVDLERVAFTDAVTGLANRPMFQRHLDTALARADRRQTSVAVLYVDLDDFKLVNDSFGHSLGDTMLLQVGRRLEAVTRTSDAVARTGGDEFLILLDEVDGGASTSDAIAEMTARTAARIHEALAPPFRLGGNDVHMTASVGASVYPLDAEDAESLLKHADVAMYDAKRVGRGGYHVYAGDGDDAVGHLSLVSNLHRAIERAEFVLHYQPIVDLQSREIVSAEALIRWNDPDRGLVFPAAFLPVAERAGLIDRISRWVVTETCRQVAAWTEGGIDLPVAFNLPPSLWQPAVLREVLDTMAAFGVPKDRLVIEITESAAATGFGRMATVIDDLHDRGVSVAIDDFGTGHSSLSRLTQLPVTTLKIDRTFISNALTSPNAATLVKTVIQLARNLGMEPIAEGIETESQRRFLLEHGCSLGQGFLFSPAVPAAEIEARLAKPPTASLGGRGGGVAAASALSHGVS
jgi:diguanylate cyclase (GGDEF)-like protein